MQQMKALHTIIRLASQIINDPEFQLLGFINESIAQVPYCWYMCHASK